MKAKNSTRFLVLLVLLVAVFSSACGAVSSGADQYEQMRALYNGAAEAESNVWSGVDTGYAKLQFINQTFNTANQANTDAISAWAQFETSVSAARQAYQNAPKNIDGNVDLAAAQEAGGSATSVVPLFSGYVSAISNIQLDPSITLAVMDAGSETFNSIQASINDWNEAVTAYNNFRQLLGPSAAAEFATRMGLSELPYELPRYQAASAGQPITNPIAPTKAQ